MLKFALLCGTVAAVTGGLLTTGGGLKPGSQGKPAGPKAVTYAEHVAPILYKNCVSCHRPGEVAPFSLVGFENARKYADTIVAATQAKRMPPWKAVHGYGDFVDEQRLTEEELLWLKSWASAGKPRGDVKKEPKTPSFSSEWSLGKPDATLAMAKPFKLDAEGDDVYRNFVMDLGNKEPVFVSAIDVRPGNRQVVHHVIAFIDESGEATKKAKAQTDGQDGYSTFGGPGFIPSGALGGWAPGVRARHLPDGRGIRVNPGAKLVMQVHYHKSGKPEVDQTKLALYYSRAPVTDEVEILWAANPFFRLQPGKKDNKVTWSQRIPVDATVYSVMPHMHLLGKSMKAWVETPDGKSVPLVHVDDWDFNWQLIYAFKQPLRLKAGSRLRVEAFYDNSSDNPNNPNDPPRPVTWGEQTTDEMALLVVSYSIDMKSKKPTPSR